MPLVKEPLIDLIKHSELTEFQIQTIITKVCDGLLELHSRSLVHGDLKMNNVYADLSDMAVKLGDYGGTK